MTKKPAGRKLVQSSQSATKIKTYRIRNIHSKFNRESFIPALAHLFACDDADFTLHSISYDVDSPGLDQTKSATITFNVTPDELRVDKEQWSFEIPLVHGRSFPTNEIIFDLKFDDFTPLTPEENEDDTEIDCIFIHGWGGHPIGSFAAPTGTYLWPRDDLPRRFPNLRVLLYGVYDYADTFRRALRYARAGNNTRKSDRPLIFVVHSLGGWLFQHAMIDMASSNDPEDTLLLQCTIGALYFGVPGQGMRIEEIISLVQDLPSRYTANLLDEQLGFRLRAKHEEQFRRAFKDKHLMVYLFYEEQKTPTLRRDEESQKWVRDGPPALSVHPSSATYGSFGYEFKISLDKNHKNMVKFSNLDIQYKRVLGPFVKLLDVAKGVVAAGSLAVAGKGSSSETSELTSDEQAFLQSLAFPEMSSRRYDISTPAEGTYEWLVRHASYEPWFAGDRGLLWVNGNPGTGKSTLMAHALELHNSQVGSKDLILSFFFHGRGTDLQKTLQGLYQSLLHQLLLQHREALPNLTLTYLRKAQSQGKPGEKWQWAEKELQHIFKTQLLRAATSASITMYIDAIDEAGEENAKELVVFMRDLEARTKTDGANLKICFSCRHYPLMRVGNMPQLCLENENSHDIGMYISSKLSDLENLDGSKSSMDPLRSAMLDKAAGSFQWVKIILDQIMDQHRNAESFASMLRTIQINPGDLKALYRTLLQGINERDRPYSLRLFQWVCFAVRPLNMDELRMALIVDPEQASPNQLLESDDYISSNKAMERRLRFLSAGLAEASSREEKVEWEESGNDYKLILCAPVVQLVHQSVLDFLLEDGLAILTRTTSSSSFLSPQGVILKSCFARLRMDSGHRKPRAYLTSGFAEDFSRVYGIGPKQCYEQKAIIQEHAEVRYFRAKFRHGRKDTGPDASLNRFKSLIVDKLYQRVHDPLFAYSYQNWTAHLTAFCDTAKSLDDMGPALFGPGSTLENHIKQAKDYWWCGQTILHIAAQCNINALLRIGVDKAIDPNVRDLVGKTALLVACERGHGQIVSVLLALESIDVNLADQSGTVPLHAMDYREDQTAEILRMLLSHPGADVNARDDRGMTILMFAHLFSSSQLLELLLIREDLDVSLAVPEDIVPDPRSGPYVSFPHAGSTALHCATLENSVETVRLLLQHKDVNINAQDALGNTALAIACYNGNQKLVEMLLSHPRILTDTTTEEGYTPLMFACYKTDDNPNVSLLLDHGMDPNIQDKSGKTALWYASSKAFVLTLKNLLRRGANPSLGANDLSTSLHNAIKTGNVETAKILIESGADLNILSEDRLYLIQLAMRQLEFRHVNLRFIDDILAAGVKAGLHYPGVFVTVCTGLGVALQEYRNDKDAESLYCLFPWRMALRLGYRSISSLLYTATGCIYLMQLDRLNWNPRDMPHRVLNREHSEFKCSIFKADSMPDYDANAALRKASRDGRYRCLRYLLDIRWEPNALDEQGDGAIHLASSHNHLACVNGLLNHGRNSANPDLQDSRGFTATHIAVVNGYADILRSLTSSSANVDIKDNQGRTPLHHAFLRDDPLYIDLLMPKEPNFTIHDRTGLTSLALAASSGKTRCLVKLLDPHRDVSIVKPGARNWSPSILIPSPTKGMKSTVRRLRDCLTIPDESGQMMLHYDAIRTDVKILRLLIEGFYSLLDEQLDWEDPEGYTLLMHAAVNRYDGIVECLLSHGMNPSMQDSQFGNTALHWAVVANSLPIVRLLLSYGADVNAANTKGHGTLSILAFRGTPVDRLRESYPNPETLNLDLERFVNLWDQDQPTHDGSKPVTETTACRSIALLLLSYGADLEAVDDTGKTPLQIAEAMGHHLVAGWIREFMEQSSRDASRIKQRPEDAEDIGSQVPVKVEYVVFPAELPGCEVVNND